MTKFSYERIQKRCRTMSLETCIGMCSYDSVCDILYGNNINIRVDEYDSLTQEQKDIVTSIDLEELT